MKITPLKNHKKIIILTSVLLLIVIAALASAFYFKVGPFAANSNDSINLDKPTNEQIDAGEEAKKQTIDQANQQNGNTGSDPAPVPQPIEGSDKKTVHMEITAANQNDSNLQVRTLIQAVVSAGECTLSMKGPYGATYTAKVDVQALASSSTCKGFDIPLDQLAAGAWTITVDFNNSELTTSSTKEIEIK